MDKDVRGITVVIPAKDEAPTIGEVVESVKPYAEDVYVVDGHSSDGTAELAAEHGARVLSDGGCGKGDAIRTAIREIDADVLVFIDADGSHDAADIPRLAAPIRKGEADLVLGSRMTGGSEELHGTFSEVFRLMGSTIITLGINYRFGVRFTDYQNGFRAIRGQVAKTLNLRENIMTIEQEMGIKCLHRGFRLAEVPTREYKRRCGESKIVMWKHGWRFVYTWLRYLVTG